MTSWKMIFRQMSSVLFATAWLFTCISDNCRLLAQEVLDQKKSEPLLTVAESSQFQATATGDEVQNFLSVLAERWDRARQVVLGTTVEGRPINALIVEPVSDNETKQTAAEKAGPTQEDDVSTTAQLTVLILGGIHPGECDGKEASLALARDILERSVENSYPSLRLIFVPNFNADGDARRSPLHRPGQPGPELGMGIRENAQGLDLNRDFVKLESPEVQCLVRAFQQYDVDVLMDLHTTNGSLHRYELTYDIPHNPAASPSLDRYLRGSLLPRITTQLKAQGINTFFYGNFNDEHSRWESYGHEPRYSTEYMGLRGRIGLLVESYSYAPYKTRFEASYHFVRHALDSINRDAVDIRRWIQDYADENRIGASTSVSAKLGVTQNEATVQGYQDAQGQPPKEPYGPDSFSNCQPRDYQVELWNRGESVKTVHLPAAYAIDSQFAWAVSRVLKHGAEVRILSDEQTARMQVARIVKVDSQSSYQGHRLKSLKVQWREESQQLNAGTYIVPASGELGKLVALLLEPESDDSLATWNFFDPYLVVDSDFPVKRLMSVPDSSEIVDTVEPGERLSFPLVMKPSASIDYSGGNRIESVQWLKNSEPPQIAYRKDGQWFAIEAFTGATRRIEQQKVLEVQLSQLEEFSAEEAKSVAGRSQFWREGLSRELLEHKGDLFVYDSTEQAVRRLTKSPDEAKELAEMSPTGSHVAFVRANDLWMVDCVSAQEVRLTQDGSPQILNGILDWVYQEELYGRGNFKGYWWSPNGQYIAYLQLDQTDVPEYLVLDSVPVSQAVEKIRYPKAGQPNPRVKVFLVHVSSGERLEVDLKRWSVEDRLIGRVCWSPDNQLFLQVFNRVQNVQDVVQVSPRDASVRIVMNEQTSGWIEIRGTPEFLKNGQFLWLSDLPDGRTHLYQVDVATGTRSQLTNGDWDVSELLAVSEDEQTAYVSGNLGSPTESHLVAVGLQTGEMRKITQQSGTHQVTVDKSGSFFIDNFSDTSSLPQTSLRDMDNRLLRVLSPAVSDRHQFAKIQPPHLVEIPARDGVALHAMVLLPGWVNLHGHAPEDKLPVLFHVYAGPQAPVVQNAWQQRNYWWHQVLCSMGYAVVICDNRSSNGRGISDTWSIRGDMGRVELRDLEDAVDWVGQQAWADSDRIGLWGWSYGGYMTAYALTHSQKFRAGIAGAPVTDWKNYDSIYTERYMDLPQENEEGYISSSIVQAAGNLHGRLLLIHGERDDNVHMSNSLQLAAALQAAGKQFDMMIYPKARHAVVEPGKKYQMYQLMTDFLEIHLKQPPQK